MVIGKHANIYFEKLDFLIAIDRKIITVTKSKHSVHLPTGRRRAQKLETAQAAIINFSALYGAVVIDSDC